MKKAVILHGMPDEENPCVAQSNQHWLPWLQEQLTCQGILAQTPELPHPYQPDYEEWLAVFECFSVDEKTHLIGHSCGAGFLVRWLSENRKRVGKVALVAPWMDPKDKLPSGFFHFTIDPSFVQRTSGVTVFVSTDDDRAITDCVDQMKELIPSLQIKQFVDRGHFTAGDMKKEQFPELLEYLIS